jgi:hypothetical protein
MKGRLGAVVFRGVRRILVTALIGLFCVALGLTIGFAVGSRQRLSDPVWLEAVGTWVGAGVTLLAVILAGIVFFSEDYARRRASRREEDTERKRLQLAADRVFCDIRATPKFAFGIGERMGAVEQLEIEVNNRSGSVVTDVVCELRLDRDWSYVNRPGFVGGCVVYATSRSGVAVLACRW